MFSQLTERRILKTKSFTFLCGPEKNLIHIHEAVVDGLSEPLHVLMNGEMQESVDRNAFLAEIEPQTLVLFAYYAYTNVYHVSGAGLAVSTKEELSKIPEPRFCVFCGQAEGINDSCRRHNGFGYMLSFSLRFCRGCRIQGVVENGFCATCWSGDSALNPEPGSFADRKYPV